MVFKVECKPDQIYHSQNLTKTCGNRISRLNKSLYMVSLSLSCHNLETSGPRIPLVSSLLSFAQGNDVDLGFLEPPRDNLSSFLLDKWCLCHYPRPRPHNFLENLMTNFVSFPRIVSSTPPASTFSSSPSSPL